VRYAPSQEVGSEFPQVSKEEFAAAAKLILPDREVRSGAHAVFSALAYAPGRGHALWAYQRLPGCAAVAEAVYRLVARHRSIGYWVTRCLWGIPVRAATYRLSTWLFLRALGAIYLIAFASFGVQAAGLIGSRGILPVSAFLNDARAYVGTGSYRLVPTLLWLNSSDKTIQFIWMAGLLCSILLMVGLNWRSLRFALFVLYLSLVTGGQVFMGYQWDALLLEAGFLAMFLGSSPVMVRLFRWLVCRFMFMSGAVKLLSGDPTWRDFTALPIHYQTQPLPTPVAWYFFQLPAWFQHISLGFLFFVELVVPFLVLAPRRLRHFAALAIAILQTLIFLTGNYAFFNLLTVALCLMLLDDRMLGHIPERLARRIPNLSYKEGATWRRRAYELLAALVILTSAYEMARSFSRFHWAPADAVVSAIAPFEVINTYGLFAVMTTSRPEIVVEGSNDGVTWLAYEFKYKPGDLRRRPVWVQPHQPRLDWQMWFAALGSYQNDPWILHFMERLLEGSPEVVGLLKENPFPRSPPRSVRALVYEYRFTTEAERSATGEWWKRELKGEYLPPIALRQP
jgi:hypothetical protein